MFQHNKNQATPYLYQIPLLYFINKEHIILFLHCMQYYLNVLSSPILSKQQLSRHVTTSSKPIREKQKRQQKKVDKPMLHFMYWFLLHLHQLLSSAYVSPSLNKLLHFHLCNFIKKKKHLILNILTATKRSQT